MRHTWPHGFLTFEGRGSQFNGGDRHGHSHSHRKAGLTQLWKASGRLHRRGGIRLGFRSCVGVGCTEEAGVGIWTAGAAEAGASGRVSQIGCGGSWLHVHSQMCLLIH